MQNVDELCIKYVLNELDSSEKLMVEQAMREDENILIEIESLKLTMKKLEQLPEKSPPEHVRQQILQLARQKSHSKGRLFQFSWKKSAYFAAAAALIIAAGLGWAQFSQTSDGLALPAETMQAEIQQSNPQTADIPATEPWIDRQNILYINITQGPGGLSVAQPNQADLQHVGALRPVTRSETQPYPVMRELQLTRTSP